MSTWIIKIWKLPFAYLPDYNQQLKHLWNVQCLNYKKDFVILDSFWLTIINHRIICYQEVWCSFPDIYMKYKRTQNRKPSIQKIGNSNLFKVATKAKPHWRCSGVFIVNFEHISHLFLMFLLFTKNKKMLTANNIFFLITLAAWYFISAIFTMKDWLFLFVFSKLLKLWWRRPDNDLNYNRN